MTRVQKLYFQKLIEDRCVMFLGSYLIKIRYILVKTAATVLHPDLKLVCELWPLTLLDTEFILNKEKSRLS